MPYDVRGFNDIGMISSPVTGQLNRALRTYCTADTLATVAAANYFNPAAGFLQPGDVLIVIAGFGGTHAVETLVVQSNNGTVVALNIEAGTP
jgi:hypothetical protein